uniref:Uncharacterized protein n=1 Tax=Oryza meridionalis TaxID=40149 RepID=A0A0E0FDU0_9ORYZ
MHLAGGFIFLLLLILPDGALSASPAAVAGERWCRRRCGGLDVPYPFGFSGSCPILLACNESTSTAALLRPVNATIDQYSYAVTSFNSTNSTFVVSLPPACNRTVSDARRWLSGANYGVSSRTGMFLRGGCHGGTNATACSIPADVMSRLLRMAQCGGGNETASSLTCIASIPPEPAEAERGLGLFADWTKVEDPRCDNILTSAYGETREVVFSLEFAVAEMGWWVNGNCSSNHGAGAVGDAGAGRCEPNATCSDVKTPSGAWGHRCSCRYGMDGDGFAAGEGCFFPGESSISKAFERCSQFLPGG